MQRAAAAGLPGGGYINGPVYYPPGPGFPQGRPMMGYGQPGMMPPRPRYGPNGQVAGMPVPGPYGQAPPQGYPMPPGGFPPRGPPRPVVRPGSPTHGGNVPIPRANGPQANGAPRAPVPQGPPPVRIGPPPAAAPRPPQPAPAPGYKQPPPSGRSNSGLAPPTPQLPPEMSVSSSQLVSANPVEQKQMLGEVLYMRIAP